MPTGYTARLYEGKDQSALEYVLSLCNQFSPFHTTDKDLKEMTLDEIRGMVTYNDTYDGWLQKEIQQEQNFLKMTDGEIQSVIDEKYNERLKEHTELEVKKLEIRKRYEDMLIKMQNWKCKDSCNNIKNFAIQQILDSINFDCEPYTYDNLYDKQTIEEYKRTMASIYKRNIRRYREQVEECKARYESNLKFIEDFIESIEQLKS